MARLGWIALALAACTMACGDDDGGDEGAAPDAGKPAPKLPGEPDPDAQAFCDEPFEACGGDVVGDWDVRTVCFESVEAILPALSEPECADAVREVQTRAAGTYSFEDDGSASTDVNLALDLDTLWTDECVVALTGDPGATASAVCNDLEGEYNSSPAIDSATCSDEDDGCHCMLRSAPSMVESSGDYVLTDDDAIDNGSGEPDPYCADDDVLRISVTAAGLTGVIVLSK